MRAVCRHPNVVAITTLAAAGALLLPGGAAAQTPAGTHPSSFVQIGGTQIEYIDFGGNGLPLLFIPTVSRDARSFELFAAPFSDRHRVIAYSPRGQGGSEGDGAGTAGNGRDIVELLDSLGISKAVMVGKGEEMTYLAEHHPDRIAGLVYLVPFPPFNPAGGWNRLDPTGAWEMVIRSSGEGTLTARRRAQVEDSYQPTYWERTTPSIDIPAMAFVTGDGSSGMEAMGPPPLLLADVVHQVPDTLARAFFNRLAADEELQEQVWAFHRDVFLPTVRRHEQAFRRAFGDRLRLVRLDRSQVTGYEYLSAPDIIEPHIREFMDALLGGS